MDPNKRMLPLYISIKTYRENFYLFLTLFLSIIDDWMSKHTVWAPCMSYFSPPYQVSKELLFYILAIWAEMV